jgi:hypothetical protein
VEPTLVPSAIRSSNASRIADSGISSEGPLVPTFARHENVPVTSASVFSIQRRAMLHAAGLSIAPLSPPSWLIGNCPSGVVIV